MEVEDARERSEPRDRSVGGRHNRHRSDKLAERVDEARRKYIPLPEEVVYEYIGEDEYLVHTDHPSLRAFLVNNLALVILLPILGPLFFAFFRGGGLNWTALVIFLILDVIVAILALRRLSDRYTTYVITNLRLIRVSGILSRKVNSIPWTRMTGLGYEQGAMGRLMGYATIHIESANEESGLNRFSNINDPAAFHQHVVNMIAAKSGQASRQQPPPPTRGERRSFFRKRRERREQVSRKATQAHAPPATSTEPSAPDAASRRDQGVAGASATSSVATVVGSVAADTWTAAKSTVRQGLYWPGSSDREPGGGGGDEGPEDDEAPERATRLTADVTPTGQPPPPPSLRPPYRRKPDQRAPSAPETIVIPTTSRPKPSRSQQLPKGDDDDTDEMDVDSEERRPRGDEPDE